MVDPLSSVIDAIYQEKNGFFRVSDSTSFCLIGFKPRAIDGIKKDFQNGKGCVYTDGSMTCLRLDKVYKLSQCELDSIVVVNLDFPIKSIRKGFEDDTSMVRLFGRFYDPNFGLSSDLLTWTVGFSTYQNLINAEFNFIDELEDDEIIELEVKVRGIPAVIEKDPADESSWPPLFLLCLKRIYANMNQDFEL